MDYSNYTAKVKIMLLTIIRTFFKYIMQYYEFYYIQVVWLECNFPCVIYYKVACVKSHFICKYLDWSVVLMNNLLSTCFIRTYLTIAVKSKWLWNDWMQYVSVMHSSLCNSSVKDNFKCRNISTYYIYNIRFIILI